MTALLTLIMLPLAMAWFTAVLSLRDGGHTAWVWVRVLLLTTFALGVVIVFGEPGTTAVLIALATVVVMQFAGFWVWRLWGIGAPVDKP